MNKMERPGKRVLNLQIDAEVFRRAKSFSAVREMTMTELVERALNDFFKKDKAFMAGLETIDGKGEAVKK
ncbi:MAG: hypothetical protein IIY58_03295 [Aeriscardovia sp.]|nr:hypothetical protein [Aeriscardovia sp.]